MFPFAPIVVDLLDWSDLPGGFPLHWLQALSHRVVPAGECTIYHAAEMIEGIHGFFMDF